MPMMLQDKAELHVKPLSSFNITFQNSKGQHIGIKVHSTIPPEDRVFQSFHQNIPIHCHLESS